ncbi:MAG: heterodisulfide reductase-related iron-sulfur binding cluster [Thermodesulfobacteriota bacterium]
MHHLIDREMLETIRTTGKTSRTLPDRPEIFRKHGLPLDERAENVIISGCQIPAALPHVLAALSRLLSRAGTAHTFLSLEYCCGNNLYRPAIKARDEAALAECRELSRRFVGLNMEQAKSLGAKRLIIFCSPCYPIYKYAFPDEDIVFYPAALSRAMGRLRLEGEIDYYAGCYRLHRKFAPVPMDLASTDEVLAGLAGLKVNRITAPKCCYTPEGLSHMLEGIKTKHLVHICTGCYFQALLNLPPERGVNVLMLPELMELAEESPEA